jgi:hypothetical protein
MQKVKKEKDQEVAIAVAIWRLLVPLLRTVAPACWIRSQLQ